MIIEAAVGDAFGAGYEYVKHKGIHDAAQVQYVQHPRHKATKPGMYTDDTQMAMAIAELLVSGEDWTALNIANKFVEVFHRDPREGYAHRFYDFLQETRSGEQFLHNIHNDSDKSGAAMRAWPIAVLPDVDEIREKCTLQAAVTHNTIAGKQAAIASALMSHYFIYRKGSVARMKHWVQQNVGGQWDKDYEGKVGSKGWMSVSAAITAVSRNTKLSDLLLDCINFGGDVDTVATIALAAASCSIDYEQDLPPQLLEGLENQKFGKDYLESLDQKLGSLIQRES